MQVNKELLWVGAMKDFQMAPSVEAALYFCYLTKL